MSAMSLPDSSGNSVAPLSEAGDAVLHSLVIPVYGNEANIPSLLAALADLAAAVPAMEVVFVVDGSPDKSLELLQAQLPQLPYAAQLIALSRNFGAFTAIRRGLEAARGKSMAVMAADLQEPPELILQFFALLDTGTVDLVCGQRTGRQDSRWSALLSNTFWTLYRRFVLPDMPPGGVDIFGCNTVVRDALLQLQENNSSLVAQLFWVGYRRVFVPYARQARQHGKSAWKLKKRLTYMLDSIFSFSDLPIRVALGVGLAGLVFTVLLGLVELVAWLLGLIHVPGYLAIMFTLLFLGFSILLTQGLIGCYLWRAFENTKRRPLSLTALHLVHHQAEPGQQGASRE